MTQSDAEIVSQFRKNLDELPRLNGFRLRGIEMTRLETFIDAAFAFAITMLVIATGQVPDDVHTLLAAFKNVPAFVASIAVLGLFWRGHWLWSRRYGLEDTTSILISWGLLVTVLIYVYPLKLLFGAMFYYVSGHRVGQLVNVDSVAEARALFAVYAIGFAAICSEIWLLTYHAWRLRKPLLLNDWEQRLTREELLGWSIPFGVGLFSFLLALLLPARFIDWSGWGYLLLFILLPVNRRLRNRRRRTLTGDAGEV